jgi:hypothetical protein
VKVGQVAKTEPRGMAYLVREFYWHSSSLGSMPDWPQSLTTAVNMMLACGHAMCIAWGKERIFLYNDAYIPMLGTRHPEALGVRFQDVWPEIWSEIEPLVIGAWGRRRLNRRGLPRNVGQWKWWRSGIGTPRN